MKNLNMESNVQEQRFIESMLIRRPIISLSFAIIPVLFFFSFADFRCNGVTVASVKGYNLVFGKHFTNAANPNAQNTGIPDQLIADPSDNSLAGPLQDDWLKPNIWAIISLAAAITGLIVFLKADVANENKIGLAAGVAGAISLVVLGIVIQNKARLPLQSLVQVDVGFRAAYWISLIAFAMAVAASYFRLKNKVEDQKELKAPVISRLNVFISSASNPTKKENEVD